MESKQIQGRHIDKPARKPSVNMLTMSNSQSFFYRSKIICDGWAALSTESSEGNDDPCATKVTEPPYGVNVRMTGMTASGDLLHEDDTRDMWLELAANGIAVINPALVVGEHAADDPAVTGNYILFFVSLFAVRCACMCLQMAVFQLAASWFIRYRGRVLGRHRGLRPGPGPV